MQNMHDTQPRRERVANSPLTHTLFVQALGSGSLKALMRQGGMFGQLAENEWRLRRAVNAMQRFMDDVEIAQDGAQCVRCYRYSITPQSTPWHCYDCRKELLYCDD